METAGAPFGSPTQPRIESGGHRVGLWLVVIYFIFTSASGLYSAIRVQTSSLALTPEQTAYLRSIPPLQYISSYSLLALYLVGGVLLALRRRLALPVLLTAGCLSAVSWAYTAIKRQLFVPGMPAIFAFLPYVLLAAILTYVYVLSRKGYLYR